jgi:hypothetical protein
VSAARSIPPTQRRLLDIMLLCDGAWLAGEASPVSMSTIRALEARGWVRVERFNGKISSATITPLGTAAAHWGAAELHHGRKADV